MKNIDLESINDAFKKVIPGLSAFELLICYLKLEKNLTLKEIGEILCISHESVRQNLNKVYKKVKDHIKKDEIFSK